MTLISPVYCTEAEISRYLSAQGVLAFSDHDEDGVADEGVVDDCINQATEEIDLFLRQRYKQTALAGSTLVNRWAVVLAARFLCQRRGNPVPDSMEQEWLRIADTTDGLLVQVAEGKRQLPGVVLRDDLRPTWSNVRVDRRWRRSTIRVTETNSSDAPTSLTRDATIEYPQLFD